MADASFIAALAKGIAASNAGLPSYSIRFTSGEHEGRYLGWNYNSVKNKRSAMRLVRHAEASKWSESCTYAIEKLGPKFEVIPWRNS